MFVPAELKNLLLNWNESDYGMREDLSLRRQFSESANVIAAPDMT